MTNVYLGSVSVLSDAGIVNGRTIMLAVFIVSSVVLVSKGLEALEDSPSASSVVIVTVVAGKGCWGRNGSREMHVTATRTGESGKIS